MRGPERNPNRVDYPMASSFANMLSAGYGFADPAVMLGAALEPDLFGLLGTKPPRTTTRRSRW